MLALGEVVQDFLTPEFRQVLLYVDVIIKLHIFLLQIHTMAIHEDYLYSAGDDGSIRVWNIKTFVQEKCIEVQYVFQI